MHRLDPDYHKSPGGWALYLASAVIVVMAVWMLYDFLAARLHW